MARSFWGLFLTMQAKTCTVDDAELLRRFVTAQDHAAFELLVDRHGPMVAAVCRRSLRDTHLAEDTFQAVFFVLAQKAHTIHQSASLGPWLHRIARRTTQRAQRKRHNRREETLAIEPASRETSWESTSHIDVAIDLLPEKQRSEKPDLIQVPPADILLQCATRLSAAIIMLYIALYTRVCISVPWRIVHRF